MQQLSKISKGASADINSTETNTVNITNLAINIPAGNIASDYDAHKAAELIKQDILNIANKNGTTILRRH